MENENVMTVVNDLGQPMKIKIIDAIKIGSSKYVIVSGEDSDEAHAYKEVTTHGESQYQSIGSGAEFKRVLEAYNSKHANE
ncbi:hypothetical protein SH2C18_01710 [Clostridium sediminicola]|uniref:DUF1292 domain-containing protein n=1 Tax=Clostridium sediminicola TaxID=3114879 RepID=UPI0031F2802A